MSKVALVVPCRNEAATIGGLVRRLLCHGPVVVVDDGSTDDTWGEARRAGAIVVSHPRSRGIGPAVMSGWRQALGAKRVVVLDAGGSHDPAEVGRLLAVEADIVIGSRFVRGGRYLGGRWWRRWGSRLAAVACNLAQSGPWLHDWTSGYRVYSAKALEALRRPAYTATMHAWQIETLGVARDTVGLTIREVPITYRAGASSLRLAGVSAAVLVWLQLQHHRGYRGVGK